MRNAGLEEAQARIKTAERNLITSDVQMTAPYGRKPGRTGELLDESERRK